MEYASLMVLLALVQFMIFTAKVGSGRGKHGVSAPSCTGEETWERLCRIQQNTMEQLVIFIPACYAFAHYVHPKWVLLPGILFLLGRAVYANAYAGNPKKRAVGMLMTLIPSALMVLVSLVFIGIELI
jgi:uncharacterized membrane protein YecN with MAPEG domain